MPVHVLLGTMKAVYFGEFHHMSPLLSVRLLTSERATQFDRYYLGGLKELETLLSNYASPILSFLLTLPYGFLS